MCNHGEHLFRAELHHVIGGQPDGFYLPFGDGRITTNCLWRMNRGEFMDGLLCLTLFNTLLAILCVSFQSLLTTFGHGGHLSQPFLTIMNIHKMHVSHIPHSSDCPGTSVLICVVVFSRPFQSKSDEIIMFPGEIQKFLWYSYGIPMVFLWYSYGIPMVFLWHSYGIPMVSIGSTGAHCTRNLPNDVDRCGAAASL